MEVSTAAKKKYPNPLFINFRKNSIWKATIQAKSASERNMGVYAIAVGFSAKRKAEIQETFQFA